MEPPMKPPPQPPILIRLLLAFPSRCWRCSFPHRYRLRPLRKPEAQCPSQALQGLGRCSGTRLRQGEKSRQKRMSGKTGQQNETRSLLSDYDTVRAHQHNLTFRPPTSKILNNLKRACNFGYSKKGIMSGGEGGLGGNPWEPCVFTVGTQHAWY